jgi:NADH-quinone oxidoreductase subunit M
MDSHLITLMIFFPFLGALLQAVLPSSPGKRTWSLSRWTALACSLGSTVCGLLLAFSLTPVAELQAIESHPWIGSYAISYDMGIDGLNVLLVLLVSLIFPLLLAAQWEQKAGARGMHALLLLLQASLLGAVCSQDLFLLFFFWALSALPFYFLIGIWGGDNRESAAFRTIVTASIGNALLFAALVLIYYSLDPHTFLLRELGGGKLEGKTFVFLGQELHTAGVAFALIGAGLALRSPIWPLHGWFTRAAEEAPPAVMVAMSAVAVPVATYIFLRLTYSLFPTTLARAAPVIIGIGAVNLVLGGICATAQRGLRLLFAYIGVGGLGLILLGVGSMSSSGVVGAIYQIFALGLGMAGFGLMSGIMIERTGRHQFLDEKGGSAMGGIATQAPALALVAGIVVASILGLPGFGGFVGQALLLIGSFPAYPVAVILAGLAILLATYYLFTMYRLVFLGRATAPSSSFEDLTLREKAYLLPLVVALLAFGIYPKPLIELVRPTVLTMLSTIR